MAKAIITPEAEEDIDQIIAYIAIDNPDASAIFYDRFIHFFETLAANPRAGRERDELGEGLRCFPVGSYLVFYRFWAGEIAITRVVHAARDLDELFN